MFPSDAAETADKERSCALRLISCVGTFSWCTVATTRNEENHASTSRSDGQRRHLAAEGGLHGLLFGGQGIQLSLRRGTGALRRVLPRLPPLGWPLVPCSPAALDVGDIYGIVVQKRRWQKGDGCIDRGAASLNIHLCSSSAVLDVWWQQAGPMYTTYNYIAASSTATA